MKVNKALFKKSLRELDEYVFTKDIPIVSKAFIDAVQNNEPAYLTDGYTVKLYKELDKKLDLFFTMEISEKESDQDPLKIQLSFEELVSLYILFSSVRENFSSNYEVYDKVTGTHLLLNRNMNMEYSTVFRNGYRQCRIIGTHQLIREFMYLFYWNIMRASGAFEELIQTERDKPLLQRDVRSIVSLLMKDNDFKALESVEFKEWLLDQGYKLTSCR